MSNPMLSNVSNAALRNMWISSLWSGLLAAVVLAGALVAPSARAGGVHDLKVLTDASPDYHDLQSLIHSATSRWETPAEKCWALFYWTHIGRRQTSPMMVHGVELTDPIRQFNDHGFTMCSTVAGINCSLWQAMGFPVRFWDIHAHTVSEVFCDGRWHMYDNSMSAIYTLCDGRTIAGVEDIGKEGACEASGGRAEMGHIARYHCLCATGEDSFLTGADCARSLEEEARCFHPNALKHRWYYLNQDRGHRVALHLHPGEVYTRHYRSLGSTPEYYVPRGGEDPEAVNPRYRLRASGVRTFRPPLTPESLPRAAHSLAGVAAIDGGGVRPAAAGQSGESVFKLEGANVITSSSLQARLFRKSASDSAEIAVSTTCGIQWRTIWRSEAVGQQSIQLSLPADVNGAYEVLVKVTLMASSAPEDARLESIEFRTVTQLNSKTLPRLVVGKNTVYVGAGEPVESIVLWPDLRKGRYEDLAVDRRNVASAAEASGYQGVLHADRAGEDGYVTFRIDAPRPIRRLVYGGRLYNRAPSSRIDFLHSFDGGSTWTRSYSLTDTSPPWDVIHHETVEDVPPGARSVLCKYLVNGSAAGTSACSIYSVRMEVHHEPAAADFRPLEVTFRWKEVQDDRSLLERSHTQLVTNVPFTYELAVGGSDHPEMDSLRVSSHGAIGDSRRGYSDGRMPAAAERFIPRWVTYGRNLARGKPYTVSVESNSRWDAGDPEGTKLTDGRVGPNHAGGVGPRHALCWDQGTQPEITVDLGREERCGGFRIHLSGGWPWWDALKGEVRDRVEVLTSLSGEEYASQGFFDLNLRRKDIPINHMLPDDETATGFIYDLVPESAPRARFVRFRITAERILTVSEVMVLDRIEQRPFDLRIALPADAGIGGPAPPR